MHRYQMASIVARIYHFDLYGRRKDKYKFLLKNDAYAVEWTEIEPQSSFYLFVPQDTTLSSEYEQGWQISDIFVFQSMGIISGDDQFFYDFSVKELKNKLNTALEKSNLIKADKALLKTQRWASKISDKD